MQMQSITNKTLGQATGLFGIRKFWLTGLFLIIAGLTFLGVAVAINVFAVNSEGSRIISSTTVQSVKDAKVIADVVSSLLEREDDPELFFPSISSGRSLSTDVSKFLAESNIVRLNLYSPDGGFIWSSASDETPVARNQKLIFDSARDGTIASGLINEFTVVPPVGQKYKADVVQTFVPFMDAETGRPVVVLGVTRDVTKQLADQIGLTKSAIFRSTGISLSVGFFILLLAVLAVDVNFRKHRRNAIQHEREFAAQELATAKLDMTNRELQQLNEERTKFLSTVSHELKTPLTSIITLTELVESSQGGANKGRNVEQLQVIGKSADHLLTMINELLDYSRLDADEVKIQREEFVMEDVVKELEDSMTPLLGAKAQLLELESDLGDQRVRLDRRRMLQLLMNLVSNASKYSKSGTTISIEANIIEKNLHLAVADQGVGISESDQIRIYTKFFRGDNEATRSVNGTGLGLSITRELVEAHGGTIEVQSRLGSGTRFSVVVPTGMPNSPVYVVRGSSKGRVLSKYSPLSFTESGRNV